MSIHQKVLYIKPIRLAIGSLISGACIGYGIAVMHPFPVPLETQVASQVAVQIASTVEDDIQVIPQAVQEVIPVLEMEQDDGAQRVGGGGREVAVQEKVSSQGEVLKNVEGVVYGSTSGKTYYFPWCTAGGRIKEENKRWFSSTKEANAAGYTRAKNCASKPSGK